jgi:hypothetical protein
MMNGYGSAPGPAEKEDDGDAAAAEDEGAVVDVEVGVTLRRVSCGLCGRVNVA